MSELYRSKWQDFFLWLAIAIFIASEVAAVIWNMPSLFCLGMFIALATLVWRMLDPYIHGRWKKFLSSNAQRTYTWAAKRTSWQRLAVNIVFYVMPMLIRLSPTCLLPVVPVVISMGLLTVLMDNIEGLKWQLAVAGILFAIASLSMKVSLTYASKYFAVLWKKETQVYIPAYRQRLARMGLL